MSEQPSPPVWTAVRTAASADRAGRRGWKACGGFLSAKEIGEVFDVSRAGAQAAGHPHGPERIAVRRMITFVESDSVVAFSERDHDRLEHSHGLFSAEVAPLLRKANVV